MKRVKLFYVILVCGMVVSGCTGYRSKKINTFYLVHSATEQAEQFFDEIQQYANTFHESLALSVVQLVYDSDYQLTVDCLYTAEISENRARNLDIRYDEKQAVSWNQSIPLVSKK